MFLLCAVLCVIIYFTLTQEDDGLTREQRKAEKAASRQPKRPLSITKEERERYAERNQNCSHHYRKGKQNSRPYADPAACSGLYRAVCPLLYLPVLLLCADCQRHAQQLTIQQGFDPLPRGSFGVNFFNTTHDANVPILTGLRNSLIVSAACAALSVYFSALTAYAIYAYDFKLRKLAFTVILLIMTMPHRFRRSAF